ncbi:MAG: hypothetical protein ACM3ON_06185 [Chloroflexota bacterium]
MRRVITKSLVLLVVFLSVSSAFGAEDPPVSKDWEFSLAPMYLWAVSIDGEQTVKGNKVDLDVSFSDVWGNLNGALIFHFEGFISSAGDL